MASHAKKVANNPFTPKLKNVLKLFFKHCLNFLPHSSCLNRWLLISNVALLVFHFSVYDFHSFKPSHTNKTCFVSVTGL